MVRIPNSINAKNTCQVKTVRSWDGKRPDIRLLLGSFYAWMRTIQKKQQEIAAAYSKYNQTSNNNNGIRKWIENNLLKTGLNDYRKTTVNLILAPYLLNMRKMPFEESIKIIQKWLELAY